MINENQLAKRVCEKEGLRKQVNIAQVKEVLRCALDELATHCMSEVVALVERHAGSST